MNDSRDHVSDSTTENMASSAASTSSSAGALALSSSITSLPSISTPLNDTVMGTLHPVKLFSLSSSSSLPTAASPQVPYTSVSHNPQGSFFITTSPNGSLQLFDSLRARSFKTTYSKKYGCSNAIFTLRTATHSVPTSCVIASTIPASSDDAANNALRFLDLNTNSFIRYFQAHTKQVTSTVSSPSSAFGLDAFYSASADGTVRAWDSRSDKCYACLANMGDSPIIALDRSGTILAIWHQNKSTVYLVPLESFPIGIIGKIEVANCPSERIEKIVWADKGLLILDPPGHDKIVIDTIKLGVAGTLSGVTPFAISSQSDDAARSGSVDVTPDGCWCLSGSGDGSTLAWNLSAFFGTGGRIPPVHPIRIANDELISKQIVPRILTINPKLGSVVTGDTEIVISIFNKDE